MRETMGLTRNDVAHTLGVRPDSVKNWEKPDGIVPPQVFETILNAYKCFNDDICFVAFREIGSQLRANEGGRVVLPQIRATSDELRENDLAQLNKYNAFFKAVGTLLESEGESVGYVYKTFEEVDAKFTEDMETYERIQFPEFCDDEDEYED
jgi:hypothetical protein